MIIRYGDQDSTPSAAARDSGVGPLRVSLLGCGVYYRVMIARPVVASLLCVLFLGAAVGPAAALPGGSEGSLRDELAVSPAPPATPGAVTPDALAGRNGTADRNETTGQAATRLSQTVTIDRVDDSRLVQFTHRYGVPNGTERFTVPLRGHRSPVVVNQTGFVRWDDAWVWDGETRRPTMVVVETYETGPSALGRWSTALTDDWALVEKPPERVRGANRSLPVETTWRLADEGVVGTHAAVLGPVDTHTERVDGQTLSLVVPEGTTPAVSPERALRTLAATERRLQGDPPVDSFVFVVPDLPAGATTPSVGMAADSDAWVLSAADDATYVHEYVHVDQRFRVGSEMTWFQEASASYLGRYLTMSMGLSGPFPYAVFSAIVDAGDAGPEDTVLSEPATWRRYTEYREGRAFLGALDARIREESAGQWTLLDVFGRLNEQNDVTEAADSDSRQHHSHVSYAEFRTTVVRLTNRATGEWLDRHARTGAWPQFPDEPRAFEYSQAYFESHPGFEPGYDLVPGAPTRVPVRLGYTDTATLHVRVGDGWTNVSVHDGDGDGRADVFLRPTRDGRLTVDPVAGDDWAVRYGDWQTASLSPGQNRLRLTTADDEFALPDSVATVRFVTDARIPETEEAPDAE